ncbi:UPF0764 protein C16orf89 homolog [Ylistrum balloti]|uniref:UPF0764 protein C16orf89 homolog n=1 Tax=Ylistrum balloti TaxID=509963 RepID=UPI002905DBB4|nr:UPF0764 protein C16orf89 homolog [Ylistrum balloti]
MVMKLSIIILYVSITLVPATPSTGDRSLLKWSLDVTEGLLDFFSADYSSINVDGLFGLRVGEGKGDFIFRIGKCNVTKNCVDMMTSKGTSGYVTTHQLLYFIVMETVKCREKVEEFLGDKEVTKLQKSLCTNIYKEALRATSGGKVMEHEKDLFLERVLLCGTLGNEDFLKKDWIKMTLQWPDTKTGCFKRRYHSSIFTERSERSTMRKILREKTMKDGCLSHTSGLGFGSFCLYLHHLIMNL